MRGEAAVMKKKNICKKEKMLFGERSEKDFLFLFPRKFRVMRKKVRKKLQITLKMMLFFYERTAIIYYV